VQVETGIDTTLLQPSHMAPFKLHNKLFWEPHTHATYFYVWAALGPTQTPIQWVPGALSLGLKWPGHEADLSPPSSVEVKNAWSCTSTPPVHLHGMVLSKHRVVLLAYTVCV
jgi:hypothetical protein